MSDITMEIRGDPQNIDLYGDISPTPDLTMEVDNAGGGTNDYNALINKPTLNGKTIQGEMKEEDPTVSEWAKEAKKPTYTPDEIGALGKGDAIPLEWLSKLFEKEK